MTQRSLSVLIVLNAILLAAIALTFGPTQEAKAQIGGGSYLMFAGNLIQSSEQVIYVMEICSGCVAVFIVNSAIKCMIIVGGRVIVDDIGGGGN